MTMLTHATRKIVEDALGRPLSADEEAGYPTLAALPPEVIDAAKKILTASNLVAVSVYLRHVVPSATLIEVNDFMDAQAGSSKPLPAHSPMMKRWESEEFLFGGSDESADNVAFHATQLAAADPKSRVYSLKALAWTPIADERLLAACERLLEDRAITLLGIPYNYGEVRWVAAEAVAAVRAALGRPAPVVIEDVFAPVTSVSPLADAAGIPMERGDSGVDAAIKTLEKLAAMGKLPRRKITR